MARERPPVKSCGALRRCVLGAALLLGLRLFAELRPSGPPPTARSAPRGPAPRPPGPHLPPAPGPPRGASRRQVTYVRSGHRAPPEGGGSGTREPGCCAPHGRPRRKGPRWRIDLQPWAGPAQSLDEEVLRFLRYISTPQVVFRVQAGLETLLGSDDTLFEVSMANSGCEVHRFDPSVKSAHILKSQSLWYHRLSIDWRDPHPAVEAQNPHSNTKKLGTILNEFGHHKIDVLKADLESAEWKVLENLILEDVLEQIGQLTFAIHLHWPGFEVSGGDSSVVRFWYSLLKEGATPSLGDSDADGSRSVLRNTVLQGKPSIIIPGVAALMAVIQEFSDFSLSLFSFW